MGARGREPTHVEVRRLGGHGETRGAILTNASKRGAVGQAFRLAVLKRLPVAVHGTLRETQRTGRWESLLLRTWIKSRRSMNGKIIKNTKM